MKWESLWMVACSLIASLPRGHPQMTCHASAGETVMLPCTSTSPGELNVFDLTLYWQIEESVVVHFFHNGKDELQYQKQRYNGRTSLFFDQVKHGNFSLKLSNVQLEDAAVYTCIYRQSTDSPQKFDIILNVSAPASTGVERSSGHSQISPRSSGDAPCLDTLLLSFHLLAALGFWHL